VTALPLRIWAALALLALTVSDARAQQPAPSTEPAVVLVSAEARSESLRYRFDNPSLFDTPALVPHFFEQTYEAGNLWVIATARYTAGVRMETRVGATPQRVGRADDYDTFYDPGNVVIVSGTTGDATRRGFLFSQTADIGRAGPVQLSVGYRLRWDTFDFHVGHKTVTRNGVLIFAGDVTSPEMTDSKVHEVITGFRAAPRISGTWRLDVSGELSPLTLGRLSVQLPEKYPGEDLVFFARAFAASARVALARDRTRWPIEIAWQAGRTWSYRSEAQLDRSGQSIGLSAGRAW